MSNSIFDPSASLLSGNSFPIATATGSVNAITATYSPALTLTDKVLCAFVATGANTTTTPAFSPDGLTAHTITKFGGNPLMLGDIPSASAICFLEYNLTNTRWELINPATNISPWAIASGSANAITVAYLPATPILYDGLVLSFRAAFANTTTTPTFSPDGLTAHTITKFGGSALTIGDVAGNLAEYTVRYNLANTRWELLNPTSAAAGGIVIRSQVFTSSGTYTPHPNMLYCEATVTGGGGGGGAGVTYAATRGHGGGAGATVIFVASKVEVGVSQVVTVGAGGAGSTNNFSGVSGGNSVFINTASFGIGGANSTNGGNAGFGGIVGYPSPIVSINGGNGGHGVLSGSAGKGGGSYWGGGAHEGVAATGGSSLVYGAGGGGGGAGGNGGDGAGGIVSIIEFCSA